MLSWPDLTRGQAHSVLILSVAQSRIPGPASQALLKSWASPTPVALVSVSLSWSLSLSDLSRAPHTPYAIEPLRHRPGLCHCLLTPFHSLHNVRVCVVPKSQPSSLRSLPFVSALLDRRPESPDLLPRAGSIGWWPS